MAGEDFGYYQGLAVRTGLSDQIGDYERHDLRMRQNKSLAESRAKIMADDVTYNNAANEFDNKRIKEINDIKVREIGAFYKENPDVMYNPDKLVILNQMKRSLVDNPEVLRGKASDDNFKALNADLQEVAKNPQMHNQLAYQKLLEQKENYLKYGNQLGLEASQKEGFKPFVYTKPREFIDLAKTGQELGNKFQAKKPVKLNNGRSGAWTEQIDENTLNRDAQTFYLENKEQFNQQHPENPIGAAKEIIRSGIPIKFDWGNTSLSDDLYKMKVAQDNELAKIRAKNANNGSGASYFVETILKSPKTVDAPERLDKAFGTFIPHNITDDDGNVLMNNDGDVFRYTGEIQDQNLKYKVDAKGRKVGYDYTPNGKKVVEGYVYKPLQWGVDNKVIADANGGIPFVDSDYKPASDWKNTVQIVDYTDPKDPSKSQKVLKVRVRSVVDPLQNKSYQAKYDSDVETTDQRNSYDFTDDNNTIAQPKSIKINGRDVLVGSTIKYKGKEYIVAEDGTLK